MDAAEIEKFVGDLEVAVDRLRSLYEQYFMGIEKLEPTVPRKDVDRRIAVLRKEQIRNTAQRFRFQMILQRYNTYQTHWQRICREIENGTYKRHLVRARQRFEDGRRRSTLPPPPAAAATAPAIPAKAAASPSLNAAPAKPGMPSRSIEEELAELDRDFAPMEELGTDDFELIEEPGAARAPVRAASKAVRVLRRTENTIGKPVPAAVAPRPASPAALPAPPPARIAAAPPQAVTSSPRPPERAAAPVARPAPIPQGNDLTEERVRQLYAQYVATRRQQKEPTATVTYEAVAKSLRDSSAKLREKHGKGIDFEVTVKDGKTILRPVLK